MGTVRSRVFSDEQITQLRRLGLDDTALDRLRHACVVARGQGWFKARPPAKATLDDRLKLIKKLAIELRTQLADTPGVIGPSLYSRDIDVRKFRAQLAVLAKGVADIRNALSSYKSTGRAPVLPIVLIARAVRHCVKPTATRGGPFYRVIETCYRAMGASETQMPSVRTMRRAKKELALPGAEELTD